MKNKNHWELRLPLRKQDEDLSFQMLTDYKVTELQRIEHCYKNRETDRTE